MSDKKPGPLEAALLLKDRFKKSFDKLPLAVQQLARPAFSLGEGGPLLFDRYTPMGRLAEAQRWDFEHDPANDIVRERMWQLQTDYTREINQFKAEIIELEAPSPSTWAKQFDAQTRKSKLAEDRRYLAAIEAQERELLAAKPDELQATLERLTTGMQGETPPPASGGPSIPPGCPVTPEDFGRPGTDRAGLLMLWARWKYSDGGLPGRDDLLDAFRHDCGKVRGINERSMRPIRRTMASAAAKNGGAPAHRRHLAHK